MEIGTQDHSVSQRKVIVDLCKTRWAERDKAYEHFYLGLPFIVKALEIINGTCQDCELYPSPPPPPPPPSRFPVSALESYMRVTAVTLDKPVHSTA